MPKRRLDNNTTKKIRSQIIRPAQYNGMTQFPVDSEGNVLPGTYLVEFFIVHEGKRHTEVKIYKFNPEDVASVTKRIVINGEFPTINHFSHVSDTPTMWNDSSISLVGKTATYEKYIDGVLDTSIDVTDYLTIDRTFLDPAIRTNGFLNAGEYQALFEVEYTDSDGVFCYGVAKQKVKVEEFITPSCPDPRTGETLTPGHPDFQIICGGAFRWRLEWRPESLTPIDVVISDPLNPAVFPTVEEMRGDGAKPFLIDLLEQTEHELQYVEHGPSPAFPAQMYDKKTSRKYTFEAINLTVGGDVPLDSASTTVLTNLLSRDINFITPEMRPLIHREIIWEPADLTDPIVFQDHQTASVPSSIELMQNVRAYWVDENGVENDLPVTLDRPQQTTRRLSSIQWFDSNGEINTYVPSSWKINYTATIPGYSTVFERFATITSKKTKQLIIEDTVAPKLVTNNGLSFPPTHLELGTSYQDFTNTWSTTCIGYGCKPNFYALDYPRFTDNRYTQTFPFKNFSIDFRILRLNEDIEMPESEFNQLQHGDKFRIQATTTDDSGNSNFPFVYEIECLDTTVPSITFSSISRSVYEPAPTNSIYLDGVTTFDLSEPVNVTFDDTVVDWSTPGFYSIPYVAQDNVGNLVTKNRTVNIYTPIPPTPAVSLVPVGTDKPTKAFPSNFTNSDSQLYYQWELDSVVVVPPTLGSNGGQDFTTPFDSGNKVLKVTVMDQPTIGASTETATASFTIGITPLVPCGAALSANQYLRLNGSEDLRTFTNADWTENLQTINQNTGEVIPVDYVVQEVSVEWMKVNAMNPDGTILYTGSGATPYIINIDVYYQGTFVHCVVRGIEVVDLLAPTITLPNDPIQIEVTANSTVDDVANELKTILSVTDDFSSFANITFTVDGLLSSEVANAGTYTKTVRAEDEAGNSSELVVTFELIISDSDGDGIGDARDEFPLDDLYTVDIDGDGTGDDDSVVIWYHDFKDTLNYLSVRETDINETLTLSTEAENVLYANVLTAPDTAQKRSAILEQGFHLQTNNVDSSPVVLGDTSLSFTLALQSDFSIDDTDTGMFIFFEGNENKNGARVRGRLEIKIKKLRNIQTDEITYRFSILQAIQNSFTSMPSRYDASRYVEIVGSSLQEANSTDLSNYTIENELPNGQEMYLGDSGDYTIDKYITNYDLPQDGKLHAYTFSFHKRAGTAGYEIFFMVDGEVKQILVKASTATPGISIAPVTYNLYGFGNMFMSDYVWSTRTEINDIINVHEKLMNTTYPPSPLVGDTDGDGLTNIYELISGEYDYTNPNTDATLIPNHPDELDDFHHCRQHQLLVVMLILNHHK
jgi:hypothetical protein